MWSKSPISVYIHIYYPGAPNEKTGDTFSDNDTVCLDNGTQLNKEQLMARLLEEDDIDDGLDVDEILREVNEIDQTLLGYRMLNGSVTQAEEIIEKDALSLEQQLKQKNNNEKESDL